MLERLSPEARLDLEAELRTVANEVRLFHAGVLATQNMSGIEHEWEKLEAVPTAELIAVLGERTFRRYAERAATRLMLRGLIPVLCRLAQERFDGQGGGWL